MTLVSRKPRPLKRPIHQLLFCRQPTSTALARRFPQPDTLVSYLYLHYYSSSASERRCCCLPVGTGMRKRLAGAPRMRTGAAGPSRVPWWPKVNGCQHFRSVVSPAMIHHTYPDLPEPPPAAGEDYFR